MQAMTGEMRGNGEMGIFYALSLWRIHFSKPTTR